MMIARRSSCKRSVGGRAWRRGFTLFEFAIAVSVIAVLAAVLLSRLAAYQQEAERIAVQQTVGALRAGLRMKTLELYLADRQNQLSALAGQNPMQWLAEKPFNYLGEYATAEIENLPQSHWFFNRSNAELIYILKRGNTFGASRSELLQFKVSLQQAPASAARPPASMAMPEVVLVRIGGTGGLK